MKKTQKTFEELLEDSVLRNWIYENRNQPIYVWKEWARIQGIDEVLLEQVRFFLLELEGNRVDLDEHFIYKRVQIALQKAKAKEGFVVQNQKSNAGFPNIFSKYWMAAASILIIIGLSYFIYDTKRNIPTQVISFEQQLNKTHEEESFVETTNMNKQNKMVVLPDGSTVILRKGSKIKYFDSYNNKNREVYLSGEAFFEVVKNTQKPFFVFTKEVFTKVVGTSFTVKAFDDDQEVKVIVKTGKVNVTTNKEFKIEDLDDSPSLERVSLTANQQVVYQRKEHTLIKAALPNPQFLALSNKTESFVFKSTHISDVFMQLSQAYGIEIIFDEKIMSQCTITATLGSEPLDEKMKGICSAIDADYQVSGGRIFVEGKSCK